MTQTPPGTNSNSADTSSEVEGPVTPEVVDMPPTAEEAADGNEQVARPTKLIRIAAMVRALLDEARRAPLDDAGRRSLKEIHERSIHELQEILSPDRTRRLMDLCWKAWDLEDAGEIGRTGAAV